MDPCCGSGHFLVAAADMLRRMRMEEAGLIRASWIVKDKEKGRRSRVYELTPDGRKQLAADEERWTAVAGAVVRVLKHA